MKSLVCFLVHRFDANAPRGEGEVLAVFGSYELASEFAQDRTSGLVISERNCHMTAPERIEGGFVK